MADLIKRMAHRPIIAVLAALPLTRTHCTTGCLVQLNATGSEPLKMQRIEILALICAILSATQFAASDDRPRDSMVLTGTASFGDWLQDAPGVRRSLHQWRCQRPDLKSKCKVISAIEVS